MAATRWGVQRQVCLAYSQAWWWECHGLGLHECCRHWGATVHWVNHECQHVLWHTEAEHDPLPSETGPQGSIPTPQTHLQDDHCLAKEAEGKGDGLAKHVSRPKPYWASVGHPQMEGGGAQGLYHPPVTPVSTCEALVNSMPKRVKAVLENNGGHTKYWHFGPNLDIFTWPAVYTLMAVCWVILRGQQIYTVIQAVHSLLYIVAKCNFFSVVTWKDIIKYLQKCEGCTHFCEILYIQQKLIKISYLFFPPVLFKLI